MSSFNTASSHRSQRQMECGYRIIKWAWGQLVDKAHNPPVLGGFWVKGRLTFYYRSFFASGCVPQGGSWVFNDGCGLERGLVGGLYLPSVFKYSPVKETVSLGELIRIGFQGLTPSVTHWHSVQPQCLLTTCKACPRTHGTPGTGYPICGDGS